MTSYTNFFATLELNSRLLGCWLGKLIGGTLGLAAEGRMDRLHYSFYEPVPTIAPPNDDLELQLVWLHLVEQKQEQGADGSGLRQGLDREHSLYVGRVWALPLEPAPRGTVGGMRDI